MNRVHGRPDPFNLFNPCSLASPLLLAISAPKFPPAHDSTSSRRNPSGSASDRPTWRMMIGRRQRELKKLYDSTEEISEPKITPVLQGVYRIQGPIDESDFKQRKLDLVDSVAQKKQSSENQISKFEKGTCNVCSTPCFSCSHLKNQSRFFFSEPKPELDKVIKEEEICPSIIQEGDNNMSRCDFAHDPKVESVEEKPAVDCKNMRAENLSRLAKTSLVSDKVEEKMAPGTKLEADRMAGTQEEDDKEVDTTDNKCEDDKHPSSSGDDKEKATEAENSDEVEDDVKVCDICGDVGQEDLLAFCTRCSDGAEHTYCMRIMMDKLPEGEWVCEECQLEVQAEKQKEKQKTVAKTDERREKKTEAKFPEKKPPRKLNSYFQKKEESEEEQKKLDSPSEKKIESKVVPKKTAPNAGSADPKKAEPVDLRKKQPTETKKIETTDTKKAEPTDTKKIESADTKKNLSVPTCENAAIDSEVDKGKLGTSLSRGALSKSTSFKAPSLKVPKVKQIIDVPQNHKISKDPASSNNMRKESDRIISKSSSFKNPNQSATTETLKKPPPKEPKDRNLMNNASNINNNNSKGASILGRPSSGILSAPKMDSSGAASSQGPDNGLPIGRNDIKKPNVPKPSGSLLPRPDDISTCSLLDSILQRNVPLATPRNPRCQRCNETGHVIQSCPKDPTRLSALKPPTERNARDGVLKRPKFMDLKELENPTLRIDSSNGLKMDPAKTRSLVPVVFDQLKSTIIPEIEFIWQGSFELVREGKTPGRYDGFQAHFSSSVSPRVPEIVKRFPLQVRLEEVPRQKTWPIQFEEGGPTENNIAIYFFARDHESYENCYMKLVESMRKNDLALKGRIGTTELLVFPSNLLPEYSQRWNKLYFLWGIFKGASFSKEGPVSTSGQDLNHCDNMETDLNSKIADNCLKDEPSVKVGIIMQEKEPEHVSVSPPLVDLNSCAETEPETEPEFIRKEEARVNCTDSKKAAPAVGSESSVGQHGQRFCEKPVAFNCSDKSPAEDILHVHSARSSFAESSKNTSLRPEFLCSGASNYPSTAQGGETLIDLGASRKRSSSMEPISSADHTGIDIERGNKKVKVNNGDLNFPSNHARPMEDIFYRMNNTEKEALPHQSSKDEGTILFPPLRTLSQGKFSTITSVDETNVCPNLNLESPPREHSTPDLELALGDTKKSPKKGPMLPFLCSPKIIRQGDGSNSKPVPVKDETATLSLSLGFPNALSDVTGEVRFTESSGNRDLFPFSRPGDS